MHTSLSLFHRTEGSRSLDKLGRVPTQCTRLFSQGWAYAGAHDVSVTLYLWRLFPCLNTVPGCRGVSPGSSPQYYDSLTLALTLRPRQGLPGVTLHLLQAAGTSHGLLLQSLPSLLSSSAPEPLEMFSSYVPCSSSLLHTSHGKRPLQTQTTFAPDFRPLKSTGH